MDKGDYHMEHCNCHFDYIHEKIIFCPLHINAFELLAVCQELLAAWEGYEMLAALDIGIQERAHAAIAAATERQLT